MEDRRPRVVPDYMIRARADARRSKGEGNVSMERSAQS
jgi:hypothetical protein